MCEALIRCDLPLRVNGFPLVILFERHFLGEIVNGTAVTVRYDFYTSVIIVRYQCNTARRAYSSQSETRIFFVALSEDQNLATLAYWKCYVLGRYACCGCESADTWKEKKR